MRSHFKLIIPFLILFLVLFVCFRAVLTEPLERAFDKAFTKAYAWAGIKFVGSEDRARPERMSVTGEGKDALVTMMPPYSIRKPGEEAIEKEAMLLGDTVAALCELAGFECEWNSIGHTHPLLSYFVRPAFEDMPWEEAMEQTLKPYDLTYTLEDNTVTIVRIGGSGKEALVTLKPPYAVWQKVEDPADPKISLGGAAKAISHQAGYKFNWRLSKKNTGRLISEWIHPDFENISWEKAMEQILAPYDLTYTIVIDGVILTRPGQKGKDIIMKDLFAPKPSKDALVTLKPPYNTWKEGERIESDRMRLSHAVNDICEQVGFKYIWKESANNIGPLWKKEVQPVFENVTWEEGMRILLDPYDATYKIEDYKVILTMKKDAQKP